MKSLYVHGVARHRHPEDDSLSSTVRQLQGGSGVAFPSPVHHTTPMLHIVPSFSSTHLTMTDPDASPDRDWFLALLVDHVNEHGGSIPLTVTVGGSLITGTLIGVGEYYERTADDLADVFPSRADAITETLQQAGANSVDAVKRHKEQVRKGKTELETPHFLHLRNVRYLSAGPSSSPLLWRGRIDDVAGFSLGDATS